MRWSRLPCAVLPTQAFRSLAVAAALLAVISCFAHPASASRYDAFVQQLKPAEARAFEAWYKATTFHNAARDAYWAKVSAKRRARRARLRRGGRATPGDYVTAFPPKYEGPAISKSLRQRWASFQAGGKRPKARRTELPRIRDYLALAKSQYDFEPERIPEREFKRRYASEALRLGLTKRQVIRVYALETGGRGTADMVAGIHPITGKGRPISTAIGYAQLLAANTINVLQKSGGDFERRLTKLRDQANSTQRRERLNAKLRSLRKMRAFVGRIPRKWSAHQRYSRTAQGRGLHALNVDGDIGPWLQVRKLRGVADYGKRAGYDHLESEQLELMNLAGPGTGLEMMTKLGLDMPTANFFARRGYERNSIVRGRTSRGLLQALGDRMDSFEKNPGAREFAKVFDVLLAKRGGDQPKLLSAPTRAQFPFQRD